MRDNALTDWYQVPHVPTGQTHTAGGGLYDHDEIDHYLRLNESALLLQGGTLLGEENEEYERAWSAEYRTHRPGSKGGPFDASAPMLGSTARYGPIASFPYRYASNIANHAWTDAA